MRISRRRWGVSVAAFVAITVGGGAGYAYAAAQPESRPDRYVKDGREHHRGKLAETTNDEVVNGFPVKDLPRLPGGHILGPTCGENENDEGRFCYVMSPDEIARYTKNYNPSTAPDDPARSNGHITSTSVHP